LVKFRRLVAPPLITRVLTRLLRVSDAPQNGNVLNYHVFSLLIQAGTNIEYIGRITSICMLMRAQSVLMSAVRACAPLNVYSLLASGPLATVSLPSSLPHSPSL
ncbi:hypothetical protein PM082_023401, partial [Marasmius tenuissimus]